MTSYYQCVHTERLPMNSNCTSKITKVRAPFRNDLSFAGFAAFPYERLRIFGQLVFSHNPTMATRAPLSGTSHKGRQKMPTQ